MKLKIEKEYDIQPITVPNFVMTTDSDGERISISVRELDKEAVTKLCAEFTDSMLKKISGADHN